MAPPDLDRTLAICDLLLGAAHADSHFHEQEQQTVRDLLLDLCGTDDLSPDLEARIDKFDPKSFDVARAAAPFRGDSIEERRKLLHLVAAIHDADEELDMDEDDYLRDLAGALALPESDLGGLALDFEVEELREDFSRLRSAPPPIPEGARRKESAAEKEARLAAGSVDVELDD